MLMCSRALAVVSAQDVTMLGEGSVFGGAQLVLVPEGLLWRAILKTTGARCLFCAP